MTRSNGHSYYPYLIGRHFKEKIDHYILEYLFKQGIHLEEKQKWVKKIPCYEFDNYMQKGKKYGGICAFNKR